MNCNFCGRPMEDVLPESRIYLVGVLQITKAFCGRACKENYEKIEKENK